MCVCSLPFPYPLISLHPWFVWFVSPPVLFCSESWSVLSLVLIYPMFSYPACLILPSLARHRGCKSAQQLLNWHVLHCLLTVLFLLDFIKTPSAVSSGMVEGVAEDEREEERQWEKSERFGGRMEGEWLNSRGECRLPPWSLVGGTPAAWEAKFDCCCKQRTRVWALGGGGQKYAGHQDVRTASLTIIVKWVCVWQHFRSLRWCFSLWQRPFIRSDGHNSGAKWLQWCCVHEH